MAPIGNARVLAARSVTLWAVRALAAGMVVYGAYLVLARVVFGLMSGSITGMWQTWTSVGEDHGLVRGVPMLLCGVALALGSRRLVTWVVSAPAAGCARCGYPTSADREQCPECGYEHRAPGGSG